MNNCEGRPVSRVGLHSAGACGRPIHIGVGIDEFGGAAFLSSPLQVVAYGDVGHAQVKTHVLLVAVPSAKRF